VTDKDPPAAPFTLAGFRSGVFRAAILVPSVAMYGVAFGIMAAAAGLSTLESLLFSGLVNAGGAQMASLQAWTEPVSLVAVGLTTLAMNSRYLLLGAALRPWYRGVPAYQAYPSLFVMGDGNWALALREYKDDRHDAAFILGSGLVLWFAWVGTTAFGHVFGQIMGDPAEYGADFMLAAFFATMIVPFFRSAGQLLPLLIGVAVAVVVERNVSGPWHVIAGALAGSLVGALRHGDKR
jgi:predicted branched-subunit amino acid permease